MEDAENPIKLLGDSEVQTFLKVLIRDDGILILEYLKQNGERRYKELEGSFNLSPNVLSRRLRNMSKLMLIERKVFPDRTTTYKPTDFGLKIYSGFEFLRNSIDQYQSQMKEKITTE